MPAYNNGFPVTYPQMYYNQYQPQQMQPQPQLQSSNGIIWVQGEAGAKSYLVAPNNTVQLWDSESQTIYLKSADASGMPSMRILDYTIRDMNRSANVALSQDNDSYVTKDEFSSELAEIKRRIEKLSEDRENAKSNISVNESKSAKHNSDV